jgi:hypothetical protein
VEQDVCYWGEMTFLSHFLNLMTKRHILARVTFAPIAQPAADRKELARQLHAEVSRLGEPSVPAVEVNTRASV